jgi:hypothetical protein
MDGQGLREYMFWFTGLDRCWIKNVEVKNVSGSDIGQIYVSQSFQVEIRRCYIHDCTGYPTQSDGACSSFNYGTCNSMLVDNIANRTHTLTQTNGGVANVYLYNYCRDMGRGSATDVGRGLSLNHGPHPFMSLVEGNIAPRIVNDGNHGNGSFYVLFRNNINGLDTDPEKTSRRRLVDLNRGSYFHTVIGNVIGDSSWNPAAYELPVDGDSAIYSLGFPDPDSNRASWGSASAYLNWPKPTSTGYLDVDVKGTLIRHGNYDYYHKGAIWENGKSQNLPASLIYSSKPDFFGDMTWPNIGPDVNGLVQINPAKRRWERYMSSGNLADIFRD